MESAKKAMTMSGMEFLQAMSDGEVAYPPLLETLGFNTPVLEQGNVVFSFVPQEFQYNPIGMVHGGVISAILDSAMGCSVQTMLPAGTGYTTIELKVNFLKAVSIKNGELKTVSKIINMGSRIALVEAQLIDSKGVIYAHAVSTCLIMRPDAATK
jgi:uncharacterized protein (TIGR00369 family)